MGSFDSLFAMGGKLLGVAIEGFPSGKYKPVGWVEEGQFGLALQQGGEIPLPSAVVLISCSLKM